MGPANAERWQRDSEVFTDSARKAGATVIFEYANENATLQASQADSLIAQKVDVLVVVPVDGEKAAEIVDKAHKAGIKVIAYDRLIKNCDLDYYISFDNEKVGEMEAQGVVNVVNKGTFFYIGGATDDNNDHLVKDGAMKVLKPYIDKGDIKIAYEVWTPGWGSDKAYAEVADALKKNDNKVDAIVCANDGTAYGAIQALGEVGLAGKVPVSGQDAELAACRRIVEGTQTVSVYKSIVKLASSAADLAVKVAKDSMVLANNRVNNGKIEVPSLLLESILVNKDNMMTTVIADKFQDYDDVYVNIPAASRPAKN
jgi:D-xylose transport system substrate-binding protein